MADRDVPAAIDKILEVSKKEKLFVVGQSMGGTILFAFLSQEMHKKYHEKVLHCYPRTHGVSGVDNQQQESGF